MGLAITMKSRSLLTQILVVNILLIVATVVGPVTVKQPVHVRAPPSGFARVTFRAVVAAPWSMSTLTVRLPALWNVTKLTVMPVPAVTMAAASASVPTGSSG